MDRDNPWIALLKAWIRALRGQSMDCTTLAQSTDCAAHVFSRFRSLSMLQRCRWLFEAVGRSRRRGGRQGKVGPEY